MNPLISVVIPVKNGAPWLLNLFRSLRSQTLAHQCEIIVVDSGSSDNSVKICEEHGALVHSIKPVDFNHGLTRQLGVSLAKGDYIFMTVQDAVPETTTVLEQLVACFKDVEVAAVCGLQIVPELPETNPLHWYRPISIPEIRSYQFTSAEFDRLSPSQKADMCSWDDVCAMYRREIFSKVPYREIGFGEDMAWCYEALRAGVKVSYNPLVKVFHYHLENDSYLYKRTLTEIFHRYMLFDLVPEDYSVMLRCARAFYRLLRMKNLSLQSRYHWFFTEARTQLTMKRSQHDFLKHLAKGREEAEKFHNRVCGITPQAPAR